MLEIAVLASAVMLAFLVLRNRFYALFFVILLTTEFYYIEIGGGIARPYHFLAVLVVLLLFSHIPIILKSKVFLALLVFVCVNIFSIIYSGSSLRASASFLSLCANIGVAMATALILLSRSVELSSFKRIILAVTLVSVGWGLLQIVAFRLGGVSLALSPEQEAQILNLGFGPGFRTEANTFGKYMVVPFLLFLPEYLERQRSHIGLIYLVLLAGIFMNFTRSSIYGISVTFLLVALWYASRGRFAVLAKRSVKVAVGVLVGIFFILGGFVNVSDYARYKLENLFNKEEIFSGGSSGYRLEMMQLIIDDVMSDDKSMLIGKGWGQTQYYRYGTEVTAGGGDLITLIGYAGFLGGAAYLLYMLGAAVAAGRVAKSSDDLEVSRFAEGTMFALTGLFCVGQMAGFLITPEYWMIIGVCIFLDRQSVRGAKRPALVRG